MKSVHNFVVTPKGERYNNTKKLDGGELILNTEIYNHQYVNKEATVIDITTFDFDPSKGDIFKYNEGGYVGNVDSQMSELLN